MRKWNSETGTKARRKTAKVADRNFVLGGVLGKKRPKRLLCFVVSVPTGGISYTQVHESWANAVLPYGHNANIRATPKPKQHEKFVRPALRLAQLDYPAQRACTSTRSANSAAKKVIFSETVLGIFSEISL